MGNYCKVFVAHKQVRERFHGFPLSNRWYSVFVVYHNTFLVSLKSFHSYRFQNLSGVIKWNMLNFMKRVHIHVMDIPVLIAFIRMVKSTRIQGDLPLAI